MAQRDSRRAKKTYSFFRQRPVLITVTDQSGNRDVVDKTRYAKTYQSTHDPVENVTLTEIRAPLKLNTVSPSVGDEGGGTAMVLRGLGFIPGATVSFGATPATLVKVLSDSVITCVSPSGTGTVAITVTVPGGQSFVYNGAYRFAILDLPPQVSSISPNLGDPGGSIEVVITGTGFQSGADVFIGGVAATSVSVDSGTQITCNTGAHASGVVDVLVENTDAQDSGSTGDGLFEYFHPHDLTPTCELLPGAYSVVGTQGINAVGTWNDVSGNNNDAVSNTGTDAPVATSTDIVGIPDFDGAVTGLCLIINQSLASAGGSPPDMATLSQGTEIAAFIADDSDVATPADYTDAIIACGSGASAGIVFNDDGITWEAYDEDAAIYRRPAATAAAIGQKHFACGRWNGTTWEAKANGSSFVSVTAVANILSNGNVGADTELGRSFAGGRFFDGRLIFYFVYPTAISNENVDKIRTWAQGLGYVQ